MVLSSHTALNKVGAGSMIELNEHITRKLAALRGEADCGPKPLGLHFVVEDKMFIGSDHPRLSCPIQFLLRDRTNETKIFKPMWTEQSLRAKVMRKAKVGVKIHSVIRLDDFTLVVHKKAPSGYLLFIGSYLVVKKDVDMEACKRWASG